MKLRNKKTGEIAIFGDGIVDLNQIGCKNVAEMMEQGWEDYEEPKDVWWLDNEGNVNHTSRIEAYCFEKNKEIGNYFGTEEEAEKAVEKLKAWERLKDKGFKFEGIKQDYTRFNQQVPMRYGRKYLQFNKSEDEEWMKDNWEDLDLLFGGEE